MRSSGGIGETSARPARMRRWLSSTALVSAALAASTAAANPQGGQVVSGAAAVKQTTSTRVDVVQSSEKAIIDWRSFSISKDEHTNFQQPSRSAVTLNRVVGPDRSAIDGRLSAPGTIFLVNQNGIVIGSTASVDVGSFVATTNDIRNENFLGGKYVFDIPGKPDARVDNHGTITVAEGGLAALVAPGVANSGTISARVGRVALGAATSFGVDLYGDGLFYFAGAPTAREQASTGPAVADSGRIVADGGTVQLSVAEAAGIVGQSINMSGIVEARAVETRGGKVILSGGGGTTSVSGTIDVSGKGAGQVGGTAEILGRSVELAAGARIDASGDAGGGTVLAGGAWHGKGPQPNAETTLLAKGSTITADAIGNGDGGTVVAFAQGPAGVAGTISARGGKKGGKGGAVETSGMTGLLVADSARVDVGADAGAAGSWLLDPKNITVKTGGDASPTDVDEFADRPTESLSVSPAALVAGDGDVVLQAQNDITIDSPLVVGGERGIALSAGRSVLVNADVTAGNSLVVTGNAHVWTSESTREAGPGEIRQRAGTTMAVTGDYDYYGTGLYIRLSEGPSPGNIVLAKVENTHGAISVVNQTGGAILGADSTARLTAGAGVYLRTYGEGTGGIGTRDTPIGIDTPGVVDARSRGSIFLTAPGDIAFGDLYSEGCCGLLEVTGSGDIGVSAGGRIAFYNGGARAPGSIFLMANEILVGDRPSAEFQQARSIEAGGDILLDANAGALNLYGVQVLTPAVVTLRAGSFLANAETRIGGTEGAPYASALQVISGNPSLGLGLGAADAGINLSDAFIAAVRAHDVTLGVAGGTSGVEVVDFTAPAGFANGGTLLLASASGIRVNGGLDLTAPGAALAIAGSDVALVNAEIKARSVAIGAHALDFRSSTVDTSSFGGPQAYFADGATATTARFLTGGGAFTFAGALTGGAVTIDAGNGAVHGGRFDLDSLDLIGTGGSAVLTGSIDGIGGGEAAKEVTRASPPSAEYIFNGCPIGPGCPTKAAQEPPPPITPAPPPAIPSTVLEGALDAAQASANSGSKSVFVPYLPEDSLVSASRGDRLNDPTLSYSSSGDRDLW